MEKEKLAKYSIYLTILDFIFISLFIATVIFSMASYIASGYEWQLSPPVKIITLSLSFFFIPITSAAIYLISFHNLFKSEGKPLKTSKIILIIPISLLFVLNAFRFIWTFISAIVPSHTSINFPMLFLIFAIQIFAIYLISSMNKNSPKWKKICALVAEAIVFISLHSPLYFFLSL